MHNHFPRVSLSLITAAATAALVLTPAYAAEPETVTPSFDPPLASVWVFL